MVKIIIPVIHYVSIEQVFKNIDTCYAHGIEKIFLINHGYGYEAVGELNACIKQIQEKYPNLWIGVNYLQFDNFDAINMAFLRKVDAIWCDNGNIISKNDSTLAEEINSLLVHMKKLGNKLEYFGGIEFKYQKQPKKEDLEWVYETATKLIDTITTSGDGTGIAIDLPKLKRIREAVGDEKLIAVASGVNSENIKAISEYANIFMVASSITDNNEIIIPEKLQDLIDNLK